MQDKFKRTKTGPLNIDWNIQKFGENIEDNTISFNNKNQRGLVWNDISKSYLIDSIVGDYSIESLLASKKNDGSFDILDGKQRLTTIYDFINGKFKLKGLTYTGFKNDWIEINGKLFDELNENVKTQILGFNINMECYENATEDEERELFVRRNSGKAISIIEKLRVESINYEDIRELANHELFKLAVSANMRNGFQDEDIVIKTYILVCRNEYNLQTKNVREVMRTVKFPKEEIQQMTQVFNVLQDVIEKLKADKDAKKSSTKIKRKTNLLSLVNLASNVLKDKENNLSETSEAIYKWVITFFEPNSKRTTINDEYNGLILRGSSKPENVKARIQIIADSFNKM